MKFIDEYRDGAGAHQLAREIARLTTKPLTIMEICGGQTHTIVKTGIEALLPSTITLVHGPGCPVCVTPLAIIDKAIVIASMPGVIFTSFGDMLRVPGSTTDLLSVKASGGDVRIVYSPLDAVGLARENPKRQVVFFAVGFETTAPANAMAVWRAHELGLPGMRRGQGGLRYAGGRGLNRGAVAAQAVTARHCATRRIASCHTSSMREAVHQSPLAPSPRAGSSSGARGSSAGSASA